MSTFRKFWDRVPRTDYYEYFNDFVNPANYAAADWTLTKVEAGAGSHSVAIGNLAGGILVSTNDAADDDSAFFQSVKEVFKFVSGKALEFECRFKISDAIQSDFAIGLQITDTTPLAVSDGIFFRKNDGDAIPDFVVCKNGTETVVELGSGAMANDTYIKLGFYYDGVDADKLQIFVNDIRVGAAPLTNVVDDEELAISFGHQNGEAVSKVLSIDYIRVCAQR